MTIRPYQDPEDREQLRRIWSIAFRGGGEVGKPGEAILDKGEHAFVAEDNGKIVGAYEVLDFTILRKGLLIPCGGVAAVSVLPESRHSGIGKAMMEWGIRRMREDGHAVSLLYPFRESYYRQFGYETVGKRWKIRCPQSRFPRLDRNLPVREVSTNDWQLLDSVYRDFISTRSGSPLRDAEAWKQRFGQKPPIIYAAGDPVEAYAWVSLEGGYWEDLSVGEFAWKSIEGYRSILATLTGLAINRSALIWHEPSNSPFLTTYADQGVSFSLDRQVMGRLIHFQRALGLLKPTSSGSVRLAVNDALVPENRGPWHVAFGPNGVETTLCESADLVMDIRQLSQAYFGEPGLQLLLEMGVLAGSDPKFLLELGKLLDSAHCTCMDFF